MFSFLTKSKRKVKQIERRASLENPSTPLSATDSWLWESLGAGENLTVNSDTALSNTALWQATGRRSRTIGSLSCKVYKKTELGSEPDYEHPLTQLLNRQPHPLYNSFDFWKTLVTNLDILGVAYAEVVRINGKITRFDIHEPKNVTDLQVTPAGNYFFIVKARNKKGVVVVRPIPLGSMIWLKGMTYNGVEVKGPLNVHKDTISGGLAATQYITKFYENGAHINFAIETPFEISPTGKNTFYNEWTRILSGIKRAFKKPLLLDKGMKLHPMKMTPADASLVESRKQAVEEMARITDMPPHMLGAGQNFTFSSIEVMNNDFLKFNIRNTLRQFEIEFENKCLSDEERNNRTHEIRFNLDTLLQGDTKTRSEKMINEFKWGLIDKNEYRKHNNYIQVEGGDFYFNPVNMFVTPTGEAPQNPANNG